MKLGLAYFGGYDQQKVDLEKEMGLQYVISGPTQLDPSLPAQSLESLSLLKKAYADQGLTLSIIEGPTPLDKVKLGLPGAEEELEVFKDLLRNCVKLDIRTICYNWMPVLGWFRTRTDIPTRGGATVTGFAQRDMEGVADTWAGKVPQERLWQTLEAFLREIVPLCEELGVRLALHPDDPPVPSLRGIGRILTSAAAFDRVFSLYDSPMNGMTFCQGCFATMGEDIPAAIAKAFYIARSGRPGPVVVDITKDAQCGTAPFRYEKITSIRSYLPAPVPDAERIAEAARLIDQARRPLVMVGQGVILGNAEAELRALLDKSGMPAASTLLGLSALPTDHPQNVGMLGMHGNYGPNIKNQECDLLVAVGMRFDDRVTGNPAHFGANAKVIHLEIDPAEIGKIIPADVAVVGDVKRSLPLITERIRKRDHSQWIAGFRACDQIEYEAVIRKAVHPAEGRIRMGEAVAAVARAYRNDAVLVTDVGQQQMNAARYFGFRRTRSVVTSGGLGTMGFGLPAAIGAKLGAPDREVVLFAGDGGLQMTIQELGTIFQSKIPVKIVLLNNSFLGMVRQWQELFYDRRYSFTEMVNPDFGLIARGNGLSYRCVERREELDEAIAAMKASEGAFLLEVRVEGEENIFPMVPAGAPVSEIRFE